ncbi:MAG: protein-L-isoaspartate(D-aspartate) O-methyltransferase [Gammaproteobacteria bacterium]|nr:protein-L-isoaspartate(D-aspartate) O-methyltransferase [Gammaproteobacteria bacterium]
MAAPLNADIDYSAARTALIQQIEGDVRDTRAFIGKRSFDVRVMQAMAKVPRHEFVPLRYRDSAYENQPLPIGHGQTISQPYIVALMTDLMMLKPGDRALEVGTGSGYQAAIMAELGVDVYSIEIIEALGQRAARVLEEQGYSNIKTRIGDGYYGWQEHAPFDVIVVTAAADHVPPPLLRQLKPGGRMVIPVGSRFMVQQLVLVEKDKHGKVTTRQILPVRFVPLTGKHN